MFNILRVVLNFLISVAAVFSVSGKRGDGNILVAGQLKCGGTNAKC
jgi:hypothetical protein